MTTGLRGAFAGEAGKALRRSSIWPRNGGNRSALLIILAEGQLQSAGDAAQKTRPINLYLKSGGNKIKRALKHESGQN